MKGKNFIGTVYEKFRREFEREPLGPALKDVPVGVGLSCIWGCFPASDILNGHREVLAQLSEPLQRLVVFGSMSILLAYPTLRFTREFLERFSERPGTLRLVRYSALVALGNEVLSPVVALGNKVLSTIFDGPEGPVSTNAAKGVSAMFTPSKIL